MAARVLFEGGTVTDVYMKAGSRRRWCPRSSVIERYTDNCRDSEIIHGILPTCVFVLCPSSDGYNDAKFRYMSIVR